MTPKQAYWAVVYLDLNDTLQSWLSVIKTAEATTAELKIRSEQWNKEVYGPKYERAKRELELMPARTEILTLAIEHAKTMAEEAANEAEANTQAEKLG